ncbi:putative protein YjbR [Dyadobacter sp. CECT 9275]|uniref:MmcQ/YjbR family DNA-binding protein n=1 Tax=Dyadobacter helix TaxID=2822344 RepID=A0A916JK64_9BACT|nr:MmcQ/YjbR family DNA-binding protein [Dyadobacter sp. CECT 9275]CAG5016344.1 putative protein YjbR [Dyadobacter sp. CECT 9275]
MNLEALREFCLALPHVTEELPFGPDALVFKVAGKMFLLTPLDEVKVQFNVKCDPEKAEELREKYADVKPGYHMNKKHWNTVYASGSIPNETLYTWVQDSYDLVVASLSKKQREEIQASR